MHNMTKPLVALLLALSACAHAPLAPARVFENTIERAHVDPEEPQADRLVPEPRDADLREAERVGARLHGVQREVISLPA